MSGEECPADGTYSIDAITFPLQQKYSYASGRTIKFIFKDESGNQIGCTSTTVTLSSQGYQSSYMLVSLLLLPIAGLTISASIYRRYKVKTQILDLEGNEKGQQLTTRYVGAIA